METCKLSILVWTPHQKVLLNFLFLVILAFYGYILPETRAPLEKLVFTSKHGLSMATLINS